MNNLIHPLDFLTLNRYLTDIDEERGITNRSVQEELLETACSIFELQLLKLEGFQINDLNILQITANFNIEEFACHCWCNQTIVHPKLVLGLQELRDNIGKPIHILSGFRCEKHNKAIGGEEKSQHLLGKAADINVVDLAPEEVLQQAQKIEYFKGFGLYKNFVHVDVRENYSFWKG